MALPEGFAGTENATLQTYSASWVRHTSYSADCEIASNRARQSATGATAYYTTDFSPASADYDVEADIYAYTTTRQSRPYVCGRMSTSANTYYAARLSCVATTSGTLSLWKSVAGTLTQLGSDVAVTLAASTTYNVRLKMSGTTIKVFLDDSEVISQTDSSITAAGQAGIRYPSESLTPTDTTGLQIDNFDAYSASGTTYTKSLSATITRTATIADRLMLTKAIGATVTRSATITSRMVIRKSIGASIARSATMAYTYMAGGGVAATIKRCYTHMKSALSNWLSPVDYGD